MADYHPLIVRAIAGLDSNTAEARRSMYERARTALVAQLRGTTPALSESDITRERLALEVAIRKVEAEEARRNRIEHTGKRPSAIETMRRANVREIAVAPVSVPSSTEHPSAAPPEQQPAAESSTETNPQAAPAEAAPSETAPADIIPAEAAPADIIPAEAAPAEQAPTTEAPPPADATPQPARSETPRPQRGSSDGPLADADRPLTPRPMRPEQPTKPQRSREAVDRLEAAQLDAALRKLRERSRPDQGDVVPRWPPIPGEPPRDTSGKRNLDRPGSPLARPMPAPATAANDAMEPLPSEHDLDGPYPDLSASEQRRYRLPGIGVKVVIAAIVLAVLGTLAAVGYRERDSIVALYHMFQGPPPVTREQAQTPPKIEDRVGSTRPDQLPGTEQRNAPAPVTQPPPAVAQRVVLYEEDPADPAGKRYVGSAIWRTETISPGPGLAPELAVKANIEIPERHITMTFSMVRNTDTKLPASHTIDVRFNLPPGFSGGGVANVPGILMKQAEQTRGVPLAGIAVKVTDNVFLIGLSAVDSDVQRNTELLKDRPWFDVPIVYANGSRAILAVEKGTPGERAFNDAFTAWGSSGTAAR